MMRVMWGAAALAAALCAAGIPSAARAEVEDVDCASLAKIAIGHPDSYDTVYCMAGQMHGRSSGPYDGNVGGSLEVIIAVSRATFAMVRFDGTDQRSFLQASSLREHIGAIMNTMQPRNWGEERRHDRFLLSDVQAQVMDDSPFLDCVAFLNWMRPVGGGPGYREAVSGLYCAMDRLKPTEAEVAEFLDGLEF